MEKNETTTGAVKPIAALLSRSGSSHDVVETQRKHAAANLKSKKANPAMKPTVGLPSRSGGGQRADETQRPIATVPHSKIRTKQSLKSNHDVSGQPQTDNTMRPTRGMSEAGTGSDHFVAETQHQRVTAGPLLDELIEAWRWRQSIHIAEKKLTLQAKAMLRRFTDGDRDAANNLYDKILKKEETGRAAVTIFPLLEAKEPLIAQRKQIEKKLEGMVVTLPIWGWAKTIKGLGPLSLGSVLGETGDLSNYETPSRVWKRMGLAVINGEAQRRITGDAAIEQGYSPMRRSVAWNMGECVIKAQWRKEGGPLGIYGEMYGTYKAKIQAANEAGTYAETAENIIARMKKAGKKPLPENVAGRLTPGHINNRAKRYMTKRLLAHIWAKWNNIFD